VIAFNCSLFNPIYAVDRTLVRLTETDAGSLDRGVCLSYAARSEKHPSNVVDGVSLQVALHTKTILSLSLSLLW
jgi:hypothetical protein